MMKKISIFTTTRADYGILTPLIRALHNSPIFDIKLVVSGSHLSELHGNTFRDLGFVTITQYIDIELNEGDYVPPYIFSKMLNYTHDFLQSERPDAIIVLGDRFEILAVALAAYFLRIPIIHLHGGEVTLGAQDEAFRHSITKLSHYHFTANEEFKRRVIQLGENPDNVFNVGALGIDSIAEIEIVPKQELLKQLGLAPNSAYVLMALHPETAVEYDGGVVAELIIRAVKHVCGKGMNIIAVGTNIDFGFEKIIDLYDKVAREDKHFKFIASLASKSYLSAMAHSNFLIGNSSSGIIESSLLGVQVIDVGQRQKGRPKDNNIISCSNEYSDILESVSTLSRRMDNKEVIEYFHPYGRPGATQEIIKILEKSDLQSTNYKPFFNLKNIPF